MVAGCEGCEQSHCCRHAAAKGCRGGSVLERAHPVLQRFSIWVIVARVHEPAGISSLDIALKRGREMNRRRDCTGCRVNLMPGMNRHRLHANFAPVFRHVCNLGSRAIPCQTFLVAQASYASPARTCGPTGILPVEDSDAT